jgi:hypothetical protein
VWDKLDIGSPPRRKTPLPKNGERRLVQPIEEHAGCGKVRRQRTTIFASLFNKADE